MSLPLPPHLDSLLAAARGGSSDALGQLFEAFRPFMRVVHSPALEWKQLRPKISESDLFQETFATAFEEFQQFRGQSPEELLAWLERILRRLTLNHFRRFKQGKRDVRREISLHAPDAPDSPRDPVDAHNESPLDAAIHKENGESVRAAIERLPEEYRSVLQLVYKERQEFDAIAVQLGISQAAVRKRWSRALCLCKHALKR
jgi:RNA polymerase sigma-70 factor (ECF subfamily)